MTLARSVFALCAAVLIAGCGDEKQKVTEDPCAAPGTYVQDFKVPDALVVIEVFGKPYSFGSAGLINKDAGIFMTAHHVVSMIPELEIAQIKLFFNGKIYCAEVFGVTQYHDAATLRITSEFDPGEFPEPRPLAIPGFWKGEALYLAGIHPHAASLIARNKGRGRPDRVLRVIEDHYGFPMLDPRKTMEMVYDSLGGWVDELAQHIGIGGYSGPDDPDPLKRQRWELNRYVSIETMQNHGGTFGGLSGGQVFDPSGNVVGIVTAEPPPHLKYNGKGEVENIDEFMRALEVVYDRVTITPIFEKEVQDLWNAALAVPPALR